MRGVGNRRLLNVTLSCKRVVLILQTFTDKEAIRKDVASGYITTAADDIHKYFFHFFSEKIRLDV